MENEIQIPVRYRGEDIFFEAEIITKGYTRQIVVDINGTKVSLEQDEEGKYRGMMDPTVIQEKRIDLQLLQSIVEVLEAL